MPVTVECHELYPGGGINLHLAWAGGGISRGILLCDTGRVTSVLILLTITLPRVLSRRGGCRPTLGVPAARLQAAVGF